VLQCVAMSNSGWAKAFDERYGRDYFYNHQLGITQWERPEGYLENHVGLHWHLAAHQIIGTRSTLPLFEILEREL
jgi:hypothetical protein